MKRFASLGYLVVVALPLSLTALLAVPEPAAACGKGACLPGFVAPRAATTIPANAPALFYRGYGAPAEGGEPVRVSAEGEGGATPIPTTIEDISPGLGALVRFGAPLEAGRTYEVRHYQASCTETLAVDAETSFATQTFTAGPTAPLPTASGALSGEQGVTTDPAFAAFGGSTCTVATNARVVRLSFTPSAELLPFLPVASVQVSVDGAAPFETTVGLDPNEAPTTGPFARPPLQFYASCEREALVAKGGDPGLTPGVHTIRVQARIAGVAEAEQPSAVTTSVDLSCASAEGPAGAPLADTEEAGCAVVRVGGESAHVPIWQLASLAALSLLRRRRRSTK
jgi:hypothetical protein